MLINVTTTGLLIGPKGATQKQMQDATGAKILIRGRGATKDGAPPTGHPDDNDDLHVHIEGSEEAVEKALKEVRSILFNPEQAMRLKNEQLQRLAEINNGGGGSDSHYGPGGSEYQIEMRVPNNMVGLIIGRGGENIARIQSTLQVNVQIAKENEMKPGETLRSIVIRGSKDNVDEAKLRIEDIIERDLKKNSMQGGGGGGGGGGGRELDHAFVVKLPVPNDRVGIIIGRGGMTIKGIQDRTKSYIQVPPQPDENDPNVRTLSIGADTKEAVDAAQMEIFMTFQSQQQTAANAYNASASSMQMLVPDDRVGIIIGKGGATIKEIQNRHRVRIQIPPTADIGTNPPMRTINIAGPIEGQQTAKYEIDTIVATNSLPHGGGGGGGLRGSSAGGNSADPYAAYGAYGAAAAAAYGSYYDPYSAAAAAYSAYYGAAAAGYSATAGTPTAAGAAAAAAAGTAEVSAADLAAYHTAYWQYAAYYGEAAARMYYGAYSPPEGTPPPEGITLPTEEQIAANTAAATGQAVATTAAAATTGGDASAATTTTAAASYDPAAVAADATSGQAATAEAASTDPAVSVHSVA